ncbi:phage head-tail connector protein [Thermicanus aegyptius]|uniref:phage head-tail connector protein n=1 Tax=Thermicanus aegyptius TaxID=94009 RepID=UPI0004173C33|nr:phage head-tail connector protein [Thermicanus aegyptius]
MAASDVLATVKTRLQITDNSLDALIDSYVQEIGRRILHYTNLIEIPAELEHTWASMTIDALRIEQPKLHGIAETSGAGEEVTVGDTSSKPAQGSGLTNTSKSAIDAVVLNYRVDLNRYRRMRW